ncbi:MAG: hypothetical protein ACOYLS_03175 [Polymorphobacter sp.]
MPTNHIAHINIARMIDEAFARLWHYDRYGPARLAFGFRDRALFADLV